MNDNDRTRLYIDGLSSSFTPTTVKLAVDGVEHDCTVTTAGTGPYTLTVTTTDYFAGPAHPTPAGAVVLTYGVHTVEVRVTASDGTTLAREYPAFRIEP